MIWRLRSCARRYCNAHFSEDSRKGWDPFRRTRERLCASGAGADANFFVNGLAHHFQYSIRNFRHAMHCRDVIREFGQDLLVGIAARLELASGNEVVTVKDSCHHESPKEATCEDCGWELASNLGRLIKRVNSTRASYKPNEIQRRRAEL